MDAMARIFVSSELNTPLWFSAHPIPPLIDYLLPTPVFEGRVTPEWSERRNAFLGKSRPYARDILKESAPIHIWALRAKEPRDYRTYFEALKGGSVQSLLVRDPFCLKGERNRQTLRRLLVALAEPGGGVQMLRIEAREPRSDDRGYESPDDMKARTVQLLRDTRMPRPVIAIQPNPTSSRRFHDREIFAKVISPDGVETQHRYLLTGGIDYVVDQEADTKVIHYVHRA